MGPKMGPWYWLASMLRHSTVYLTQDPKRTPYANVDEYFVQSEHVGNRSRTRRKAWATKETRQRAKDKKSSYIRSETDTELQ